MTIDEVKNYFGTWYRYEALTGSTHSNHLYWKRIGYIPILTQNKLEKLTEGALKARYHDGEGGKDVIQDGDRKDS
jgi:hypothetical protein